MTAPGSTLSELPAGRRRPGVVRWLVPVGAAAALALAFALADGPGEPHAYASWSPTPQPVEAKPLATAEKACLDNLRDDLARMAKDVADQRPTTDPDTMRTVVAEKRGGFLFLAMSAPDGSTQQCFFTTSDPATVNGVTGGLATASSAAPVALKDGQIEAWGGGKSSGPEGTYSFTTGRLGPGVRAVTIRTQGRDVNATVNAGNFAAWWPSTPTPADAPSPGETYDLTLADGRVVRNAPNVATSGRQPTGGR
ncbi:hypothetical protein [Arsenicicoccus sp. oral taxon 190]|uniref:hypothetical protein n=1 Tax=Arsenicicoccus sp. oral taxon 190 TaxID=1658671 RepID=UPI00067A3D5F|nr:hypothetical protein [Arsenicicoccus sp. oral taxon 190]AKT50606.1 hypothetical protein ADJ73_03520 [Arsenicicoccus sp. oral taxon 190]